MRAPVMAGAFLLAMLLAMLHGCGGAPDGQDEGPAFCVALASSAPCVDGCCR